MSRCFPYPPPGYALSCERNEALIESIKLQEEKQRKEEKRRVKKERRREKKEKRRERKERRKEKTTQNLDKSDIIKDPVDHKICSDLENEFQKRRATESEQFEQSSLTEEHGHPDILPVPSSSYESTETSNKRKRPSSPISDSHNHGHGKPILIRLPSKMQSDVQALTGGQQLRSVSGRTEFPSQHKHDTGSNGRPENFGCTSEATHNVGRCFSPRSEIEETCSTSRQIELQYKDLLDDCFPPQIEDASLSSSDSDWLFQGRKRNQDIREKRQRCGSDSMSCSRSSSLWPRAEYLLEVDAYALPFVVPY